MAPATPAPIFNLPQHTRVTPPTVMVKTSRGGDLLFTPRATTNGRSEESDTLRHQAQRPYGFPQQRPLCCPIAERSGQSNPGMGGKPYILRHPLLFDGKEERSPQVPKVSAR